MGGPLERMEWWRHRTLLLGEGSANGSESLDGDSDEELKVLQCVLAESQRSKDGAGSSSGSGED